MSGDVFAYDESIADTSSGDVQGVISGIESSLADLGGFVAAAKSAWEGDEQEQYTAIQQQWDGSAATVQEILTAIHGGLGATTEGVKTMRSQVTSALQQS